jgi:hypothetical protein
MMFPNSFPHGFPMVFPCQNPHPADPSDPWHTQGTCKMPSKASKVSLASSMSPDRPKNDDVARGPRRGRPGWCPWWLDPTKRTI